MGELEESDIKVQLPLYFPHRGSLQSGDLLQWRSESMLGGSIRFFRRLKICINQMFHGKFGRPWVEVNHSSQVIKGPYETEEVRRWHGEAMVNGLVPRKLSDRLMEHKGQVWWYPLLEKYDDKRDCISQWWYDHLYVGYDFLSVFRQIYRKVKIGVSRMFCSEAVCACVKNCKLTTNEKALPPDQVTTLDLWQSVGIRIK